MSTTHLAPPLITSNPPSQYASTNFETYKFVNDPIQGNMCFPQYPSTNYGNHVSSVTSSQYTQTQPNSST